MTSISRCFDILAEGFLAYDKRYYAHVKNNSVALHLEMPLAKRGKLSSDERYSYEKAFLEKWNKIEDRLIEELEGERNVQRCKMFIDVGKRTEKNHEKITAVQHFGLQLFPTSEKFEV
jgi:hypothetical protein